MPLANKTKSEQVMSGLTEAMVRERLQKGTLDSKQRDKVLVREAQDIGQMKKAMKDVAKYLKAQAEAAGTLKGRGFSPEMKAQINLYKQTVSALQKGGTLNGKSMVDLLRQEHKVLSDLWRAAKNDPALKTRLQASGLRQVSAREGEIRQFTNALGATIADFNRGLVENFSRVVTKPKIAGRVNGASLAGAPVTVQSRLVEPVVDAVQANTLHLGDRLDLIHHAIQQGTRESNENAKRDRFERWRLALKGAKQKGDDLLSSIMNLGRGLFDKLKWLFGGGLAALFARWFGGKGQFWAGIGTAIKSGFNKIWTPVAALFKGVGAKIGTLISKLSPAWLKEGAKKVGGKVAGIAGSLGAKAAGVGAAALGLGKNVAGVAGKVARFGLKAIPGLGLVVDSFFDFKKGQAAGKGGVDLAMSTMFGDTGKGKKAGVGDVLGHVGGQALKWGALGFAFGGPVGAAIGAAVGGGIALIKDGIETGFFEKAWPVVKAAGKVVVALWNDLWRAIKVNFKKFTDFMGKTIKDQWGRFTGWVGKVATDAWTKVSTAISGAIGPVMATIQATWGRFSSTVSNALGSFVGWIGGQISTVVEGAKVGVKATKDTLGNLAGKVGEIFTAINTTVGGAVATVWNAITNFDLGKAIGGGLDAVKTLTGKIGAFLQELFSLNGPIAQAIGNAVQGGLGFVGNLFGFNKGGTRASGGGGSAPTPARVAATGTASPVNYSPKQVEQDLKVAEMQARADMANAQTRLLEAILKDRKGAKEMGISDRNIKDLVTQMFDPTKAHPAFAPIR